MLLFLLVIAAVFFAEQQIKARIRSTPAEKLSRSFCKGHVQLERVENEGFSASRWQDRPEVVQAVSAFAVLGSLLAALPELIRRRKDYGFLLGAGLLFGGGLANLFDRTFRGSVTDYLRFPKAPWKKLRTLVFNAADLCIFLGTFLILIRSLTPKKK